MSRRRGSIRSAQPDWVRNGVDQKRKILNFMHNPIPTLLAFAAVWAVALMSNPAAAQGTPEQRAACQGDALLLCGQCIPDVNCITSCMIQRQRYVSAACRSAMRSGTKRRRARD